MAVLNKIRQRSLVLIVVIALALFSFVLADLFRNSDALSARSQNTVASINDIDIDRNEFLEKVEFMQRRMGPTATNTQVMNNVWNQELREAIFKTQYDQLGITVEQDQMRDLLKTPLSANPEFLNDAGLFDENKLNEFIANLKEIAPDPGYLGGQPLTYEDWVDYEQRLATSALESNYFNLVKAGLVGTLAEGELSHKLEGNLVDIKYVQIPYTSIADSTINVTKEDIKNYIKEHKKEFEVEASRDIKYVEFKEVASIDDENAIQAELGKYIKGTVEYTNGRTDSIKPFAEVDDIESYVNLIADSDVKYDSRFKFKKDFTAAIVDSLYNLEEGQIYGPYRDGDEFKLTRLVATKNLPDSAKVRHILIPFIGAQQSGSTPPTRTEAQAKVFADSLLDVLKKDTSKFPEFVKEFSSDQGSVANEGRYDWHPLNTMVPEFNDFEFEGKVGDLDVVKTIFGFHIIEIEGQKEKKKAIQVATIARKVEPSDETLNAIFRDASRFEGTVQNADFEASAREKNYAVRPVNGIKILDENIPGIGNNQRPIVRWAFEEETEVGDVKRFTIPNGYAIAQLVAIHEEGLMPVEDASANVLPKIRKERKAQLIKERVSASTVEDLASSENTSARNASAVNMKNPTISGAGREPLVVGAAFALNEGETSGLIEGDRGVYMVQVTKITPAVELDNYQAAANRIEQQKSNVVTSKLFNALKEAADIEDNRAKLQIQ